MMNRDKDDTSQGQGLTEAQKSLMESLLKSFQSTGATPDISDIPPDLLSKVMADPKARQDARDMLEKFQRERKLPQGRGDTGGLPMPPRSPQEWRPGDPEQNPDRNLDNQTDFPLNRPTGSQTEQPQRPGQRPQANNQSAQPLTKPPVRKRGESNTSFLKRFDKFLENQIQQQRDNGETEGLSPSELPPPEEIFSPRRNTQNYPERSRMGQNPDGQNPGQSNSQSQPDGTRAIPPAISDFLKNLNDLPSPSTEMSPREGQTRGPTVPETNAAQEIDQAERRRLQEQAKRDLESGGLKATLKKMVKETKQELKKNASSKNNGRGQTESTSGSSGSGQRSPGMENAIIRALDGISKDVMEIAKDVKFKSKKPGERKATQRSVPRQRNSSNSDKDKGSWGSKASDFFSGLSKTPSTPSPRSAAASASETSGPTSATASPIEFSFAPFLVLGFVALLVLVLAWKSGLIAPTNEGGSSLNAITPAGLKTREDIVRAFHQFALQPNRGTQDWWTHQQVKEQIRESDPHKQEPIEILADVYERARYLPEDINLEEHQLAAARAALRRCRS